MAESNLSPIADESVATGTLMPLVSIKKHYKISLSIFSVIVLLGLPFAWFKGISYYSVTAVIHVAPRVISILQESKEQEFSSYQQYKQFVDQQVGTVGRYDIVLNALKKMGDKRFLWQKKGETDRRAAERLQAALVIKPVNDSYLMSVTLESDQAEGLDDIVNTVVKTYVENAHEEELLYASKERVDVLYDQRNKLQKLIAEKRKHLEQLAQELSVTIFLDGVPNPFDQLLSDSQSAYSVAQRDRMAAEAGLLLFENPHDTKATAAFEAIVADIVYKDQGLFSLKANMYERRSELVKLIRGLSEQHPGHAQIKKQLAVIEAEVVEATEQLTNDVKRMILEERRSKVTLTRKIEQDLLTQINAQKKNAAWFAVRYQEGLTLNQDEKSLYEQLKVVENRISSLELESKAPGFVRVESLARSPEIPVRGGRKKLFIMAIVIGFLAGCGVPIVIDMLDKRIKTSGQVEKLLGYKPLAGLLEPHQEGASPKVIADQKRRILLALERERKETGRSSSLIVLTSVKPQSAVTSLAMDLALDCKKIGLNAIVIEINLLKPDERYLSPHTTAGFIDLALDFDIELSQVTSPADDNYPDRIAIGLSTEGLLCDYVHLQAVLNKIAETYPMVILDTAPVLLSADTEFFVSISDVTLLLIAAKETKSYELKRAVKLLERINPKVISFIVTRLEIFRGGGYYASIHKDESEVKPVNSHLFAKYFKKHDS